MQLVTKRIIRPLFVLAAIVGSAPALAGYDFQTVDYPGTVYNQIFGVNNSGILVGTGYYADDTAVNFNYDTKKKKFTPISAAGAPPPTETTSLLGINESGTMVGSTGDDLQGAIGEPCRGLSGLIRSKNGSYTTFSHPGWANTQARAVGNSGLVTGFSYNGVIVEDPPLSGNVFCESTESTGFIYDPASTNFIPVLPSGPVAPTITQGINARGEVVGGVFLDADVACPGCPANRYGFRRAANGDISYFRVNGRNTAARGINDLGVITGYISLGGGAAKGFVVTLAGLPFEDLTIPDAELLVADPDALFTGPQGITNAGVVVGGWTDADGNGHGFIATPPKGKK